MPTNGRRHYEILAFEATISERIPEVLRALDLSEKARYDSLTEGTFGAGFCGDDRKTVRVWNRNLVMVARDYGRFFKYDARG